MNKNQSNGELTMYSEKDITKMLSEIYNTDATVKIANMK